MTIEIRKPDLLELEIKCISVIQQCKTGNCERAAEIAEALRLLIREQRDILNTEWRDMFFKLANTL